MLFLIGKYVQQITKITDQLTETTGLLTVSQLLTVKLQSGWSKNERENWKQQSYDSLEELWR